MDSRELGHRGQSVAQPPAISLARFPQDLAHVRALFEAYAESLDVPFCRADLERELDALPGPYAEPGACVMLARAEAAPVGCVALKAMGDGVVEMARLYVQPAHRRDGLGRALAQRAVKEAQTRGHARLVLHTMAHWQAARALYKQLGFEEIAPYVGLPIENVIYLGRALGGDEDRRATR